MQTSSSAQVMDTVSLPAGDAKPDLHKIVSITSSTKPSVIHDYKVLVKGMVGLMLRLSHEGSSPGLIQDLESAASSLVRALRIVAAVHACQTAVPCEWPPQFLLMPECPMQACTSILLLTA